MLNEPNEVNVVTSLNDEQEPSNFQSIIYRILSRKKDSVESDTRLNQVNSAESSKESKEQSINLDENTSNKILKNVSEPEGFSFNKKIDFDLFKIYINF